MKHQRRHLFSSVLLVGFVALGVGSASRAPEELDETDAGSEVDAGPEEPAAPVWQPVGGRGAILFGTTSTVQFAINGAGAAAVAFSDFDLGDHFFQLVGDEWVERALPIEIAWGGQQGGELAVDDDGNIWIGGITRTGGIAFLQIPATGGDAVVVGDEFSSNDSAGHPEIAFAPDGTTYAAYTDRVDSNEQGVFLARLVDGVWQPFGPAPLVRGLTANVNTPNKVELFAAAEGPVVVVNDDDSNRSAYFFDGEVAGIAIPVDANVALDRDGALVRVVGTVEGMAVSRTTSDGTTTAVGAPFGGDRSTFNGLRSGQIGVSGDNSIVVSAAQINGPTTSTFRSTSGGFVQIDEAAPHRGTLQGVTQPFLAVAGDDILIAIEESGDDACGASPRCLTVLTYVGDL